MEWKLTKYIQLEKKMGTLSKGTYFLYVMKKELTFNKQICASFVTLKNKVVLVLVNVV